jgi:hypothetical protein
MLGLSIISHCPLPQKDCLAAQTKGNGNFIHNSRRRRVSLYPYTDTRYTCSGTAGGDGLAKDPYHLQPCLYPANQEFALHLHTHVYCGTIHNSQVMETAQDAPSLTNGLRKCGIYTQWNFMQP